jgi:predicted phage terminase large subunit-like protein
MAEAARQVYDEFIGYETEIMTRDFREFVAGAWSVVEPGKEYVANWHIDAICEHLMWVSLGDIDDLVINIPPRHSKSLTCAVFWPAWEWTWLPSSQWLFATYAQPLTIRDSIKCRRLIQSPWYQARFGHAFQITSDQNQKTRFENNHAGYRLATSVGGTATGEGGDRIVIDDAHNMKEINSDTIREGVIEWWRDVMSTRANNPKKAGRVIIAQRGHHRDLPGYILEDKNVVHLNLPGYFIPHKRCITFARRDSRDRSHLYSTNGQYTGPLVREIVKGEQLFEDPRTRDNELLNPDRFGETEMGKLAATLTERAFEAQIQQNPSIAGGNIIKTEHWREWKEPELPTCQMVIQSYDTAFEEDEENDFSARTTWGVFEWEEEVTTDQPWAARYKGQKRLCLILLERLNERMEYPELRKNALRSNDLWRPDKILIEKKSSGHALAQELRRAKLPVARVKVNDSKWARAHASSLVFERGCVWYVSRNWAQEVIQQCAEFPAGEFDDLFDTVTQACLWLRRKWNAEFLDDDDDDVDYLRSVHESEMKKRAIYG